MEIQDYDLDDEEVVKKEGKGSRKKKSGNGLKALLAVVIAILAMVLLVVGCIGIYEVGTDEDYAVHFLTDKKVNGRFLVLELITCAAQKGIVAVCTEFFLKIIYSLCKIEVG